MVIPGDNLQIENQHITPVAIDKGQRLANREGGRTVGRIKIGEGGPAQGRNETPLRDYSTLPKMKTCPHHNGGDRFQQLRV
jgi:hypothetical protein